jgi:6-phospho-beta-glucosidase
MGGIEMEYKFPEKFFFGAAASGPQTEGTAGKKGMDIYEFWYESEPEDFYHMVGPKITSDFYHRYIEDIGLMKEMGLDSYRTSIEWSRLIPEGTGDADPEAVDFYNRVIDELKKQGIEPYINLFHFDLPVKLQKIGGWESRKTVDAYVDYARVCFDLFGDRVKNWFTFSDPLVPAEQGYVEGNHYPKVRNLKRAVQVAYNMIVAHASAVEAFREMGTGGEIGVIMNLSQVYPKSGSKEDIEAAEACDLFINKAFLDPVLKGEFPEKLVQMLERSEILPEVRDGDKELIARNRVDILGISYFKPRRVMAPADRLQEGLNYYFVNYRMPGRRMNVYRGWEIYEKGIYDLLTDLRLNYGNPACFIAENGIGVENEERYRLDGEIHDTYRIDYIRNNLKWILKAVEEGSDCRGYHAWSFTDNWSWNNGFKNRYGFVAIDTATLKRTVKLSGEWIKEVTRDKGFSD